MQNNDIKTDIKKPANLNTLLYRKPAKHKPNCKKRTSQHADQLNPKARKPATKAIKPTSQQPKGPAAWAKP